jgi:hypothetical protein
MGRRHRLAGVFLRDSEPGEEIDPDDEVTDGQTAHFLQKGDRQSPRLAGDVLSHFCDQNLFPDFE